MVNQIKKEETWAEAIRKVLQIDERIAAGYYNMTPEEKIKYEYSRKV